MINSIKIKVLSSFLLLTLSSPAFAEVQPPEWSEFCPPSFLNTVKKGIPAWQYPFLVLAPTTIPMTIIKKNEANYWANRRINFEQSVLKCKDTSDIENCYSTIRVSENNKSNMFYQEKNLKTQRARLYNSSN